MAGLRGVAQAAEASTTTSKRTMIQLIAPANQGLVVKEWSISFKGTSNTAAPILVEVAKQTTAGTVTSLTPQKMDPGDGGTIQATAGQDASAEPTQDFVVMSEEVHPQGAYTWQAPYGGEIKIAGGGRLGIAVTAGAAVNCVARFIFEE